ncbi:MAG: hypothetical protein JNJ49_12355 [Bdellovibrionaceae bacterium]|nr:hypothetical protein [Pseudobdellovibrionaceae bacterium]
MATDSRLESCVVLYSGGTDSTCAAAIEAERYRAVHLLTFEELATRNSPLPTANVERLRARFSTTSFYHVHISTDRLVRRLSYENYLQNIVKHGFFVLSTPGYSSLSWHLRTIQYCVQNNIRSVYDGMTRELTHLPGHMPAFRDEVTALYRRYGLTFSSPVLDWDVPHNQQLIDRLVVDRHGFALAPNEESTRQTTGRYLYERNVLPRPDVKGSLFDQQMQHDCYPFVVFNMFVFCNFLFRHNEKQYAQRIAALFRDKIAEASPWLDQALRGECSDFEAATVLSKTEST